METAIGLLQFEQTTLQYEIKFSAKRRTLGIEVHSNSRVIVRAPAKYNSSKIEAFVQQNKTWITKKLEYVANLKPRKPPRQYITNEMHLYLGQPYRLIVCAAKKTSVELIHDSIVVSTPSPNNPQQVKKCLYQWYRARAYELFPVLLNELFEPFAQQGYEKPNITVRFMRRQWGNYLSNPLLSIRLVTLNSDLIRAPKNCIEYVVVHELCHMKYQSHGKRFYQLLSRVMPDWKERERQLKEMFSP